MIKIYIKIYIKIKMRVAVLFIFSYHDSIHKNKK